MVRLGNRTYRPDNRINPVNLVLEEKTTRIVEMIVSSIKSHQLLLGKLMGVCSVVERIMAVEQVLNVQDIFR